LFLFDLHFIGKKTTKNIQYRHRFQSKLPINRSRAELRACAILRNTKRFRTKKKQQNNYNSDRIKSTTRDRLKKKSDRKWTISLSLSLSLIFLGFARLFRIDCQLPLPLLFLFHHHHLPPPPLLLLLLLLLHLLLLLFLTLGLPLDSIVVAPAARMIRLAIVAIRIAIRIANEEKINGSPTSQTFFFSFLFFLSTHPPLEAPRATCGFLLFLFFFLFLFIAFFFCGGVGFG